MFSQTIALFRYQLLGIMNARILILLGVVFLVASLGGQFVSELAIINSQTIALAAMADFLRYSLILLLIISLAHQVSQDYELSQFERLLAMPITRAQYVLAQFLVLVCVALVLMLPVFILLAVLGDTQSALYWSTAILLEMLLVGQFTLLAIISLEKLPVAVVFTLAIYLLSRSAPVIDLILSQSSSFYDEERGFQLTYAVFSWIRYLLPDLNAFAQNNMLFDLTSMAAILGQQLMTVIIYSLFIQFVILLDFYRKEFNQA